MIIVKGGVTKALGFLANGLAAGIKKSGKMDLALLYSEVPAAAAAAFTTNAFQASPLKVSRSRISNAMHQAIIVNSGNANCANGASGDKDAALMADYAARSLRLGAKEALVASTGIIGKDLPIGKIKANIPALVAGLSAKGGDRFAEAILTTDTVKKEFAVKLRLGYSTVTIGGACKGVGMIYPNMKVEKHATLLSFLTTDAAISKRMLTEALGEAIEDSFNMVSVDGDMSTNDSCFMLANGLAGNRSIVSKDKYYIDFTDALKFVTSELTKMLARDGEGATKLLEIEVLGAKSKEEAARVARKVSTSNLLKCCIYSADPNWGRVVAASGASGVRFDASRVDVYLGGMKAVSGGRRVKDYDSKKARKRLAQDKVYIKIDLNSGRHKAAAWTCDFSEEYVRINANYST